MNVQETNKIRELAADEIEAISGGMQFYQFDVLWLTVTLFEDGCVCISNEAGESTCD
jgi:hypothetical protein